MFDVSSILISAAYIPIVISFSTSAAVAAAATASSSFVVASISASFSNCAYGWLNAPYPSSWKFISDSFRSSNECSGKYC